MSIGAVAFRHNRIKNRGIVKNTIPLHKKSIFEGNEVENLRFSSILNETAPLYKSLLRFLIFRWLDMRKHIGALERNLEKTFL